MRAEILLTNVFDHDLLRPWSKNISTLVYFLRTQFKDWYSSFKLKSRYIQYSGSINRSDSLINRNFSVSNIFFFLLPVQVSKSSVYLVLFAPEVIGYESWTPVNLMRFGNHKKSQVVTLLRKFLVDLHKYFTSRFLSFYYLTADILPAWIQNNNSLPNTKSYWFHTLRERKLASSFRLDYI